MTRKPFTAADLELARTCIHESAHAVAGVLLGGELYTAVAGRSRVLGSQGVTTFEVLPERYAAQVAFAGPWAAVRFATRHRLPSLYEVMAALDRQAGGHLCDREVLIAHGGQAAGAAVAPLLDRNWHAVVTVATGLWRRGEVFDRDVAAALGLSPDPATRALELANVRAGLPLGTFTVAPTDPARAERDRTRQRARERREAVAV